MQSSSLSQVVLVMDVDSDTVPVRLDFVVVLRVLRVVVMVDSVVMEPVVMEVVEEKVAVVVVKVSVQVREIDVFEVDSEV